jgi:hypothetical protein
MNSLESYLAVKGQLAEARKGLFVWEDSGEFSVRRDCDRHIIDLLTAIGCQIDSWIEKSGEYYVTLIGPGERRAEYAKIISKAEYGFGWGDVALHESFFQGEGSDGERYDKFLRRNGYSVVVPRYSEGEYQVYRNPNPSKGALRFVRWLRD